MRLTNQENLSQLIAKARTAARTAEARRKTHNHVPSHTFRTALAAIEAFAEEAERLVAERDDAILVAQTIASAKSVEARGKTLVIRSARDADTIGVSGIMKKTGASSAIVLKPGESVFVVEPSGFDVCREICEIVIADCGERSPAAAAGAMWCRDRIAAHSASAQEAPKSSGGNEPNVSIAVTDPAAPKRVAEAVAHALMRAGTRQTA